MTSSSVVAIFAALLVEGQIETLRPFEAVEAHMGTLFRIKLYAENEQQAKAAFRSAFERVTQLDTLLTDYRRDSELSRVTQYPVGQQVTVAPDLFRVLRASQEIAEQTDGAFDITLGPLTHLWRTARKNGMVPDETARREALHRCGFRKLHVGDTMRIMVDATGMQLDAGGIAKGYAADEALACLRAAGISRALVAASGDLAFSGAPPGKPGWRIGVDSFDDAGQPFARILVLQNAAVSTSGDAEQHLDANGVRYSHILNPKTGVALTNRLTVTVVAPSGMEADAASTAISVLGQKRGLAFADTRPGMAALVVDHAQHPVLVASSLNWSSINHDQ